MRESLHACKGLCARAKVYARVQRSMRAYIAMLTNPKYLIEVDPSIRDIVLEDLMTEQNEDYTRQG